ncbi:MULTISPECIES: dynamin family protein [unclassified Nodularia (in: cyanobacteria)]|uniref:dynamin family protein n=1 Tax=unclassified Nodularia (in: cyanobacteria) TaxID=2656917 RepID=UPI0018814094|nr:MULTISPECIES: dynamin family protein [unclassified Nodularia (in: cyanobacteria)]MBE9201461.1 dynamin family protein [Nodularia sp. LEGE 06071]MCC2691455.1 dynamin family protein [Nodularia sp. LEGE 04288]
MNQQLDTDRFINDLERVAQVRSEISGCLSRMADTIKQAELSGESSSGKLSLERDIEDITVASKNLKKGVFRLLVLGDMKRGKSTFLNALIGENLLPSDVNPCTAVLTILRYGAEKTVTIHFNDGKHPQKLDFSSFKYKYTIDPAEAKKLEQEKKQAFPDVDYAVVEYPLALLEKGIEIVDSPGLNDTEARNELSLGYVNNCHAILFVMRASQPCTLGERRYLENYIKGRGLSVFFLINAWDQVRESLIDPDDTEELQASENRLRQVFKANLAEYCTVDGQDIYEERVFEVSSIQALRRRLKNPQGNLAGTGFPEFMGSLNTFLTRERAIAELRQVRTLGRQACKHTQEAISRRLPLLDQDVNELKKRLDSVEPEFNKLTSIRDEFQKEIINTRDTQARKISESFRGYVLNLGNTFETDFLRYQPELNVLDFLSSGKREAFNEALQKAFEQYIADKAASWTLTAEKDINGAFQELSRSAAQYGASYNQVTDQITEKLTGQPVKVNTHSTPEDDKSPGWAKWAMGLLSLSRGNLAGVALAGAGFDWKNILLNYFTVIGVAGILTAVTNIFLGPIGFALLGLGVGFLQADQARKELVKTAKKELVKYLPQIAHEQSQTVYDAVKECFDSYEKEVSLRINDDIVSRKAELDNLIQQKETREINRDSELQRLKKLQEDVIVEMQQIEAVYSDLLAYYS